MSLRSVTAGAAALSLLAVCSSVGAQSKGDARRGEYLVKGLGCADCHTPQKMGAKGPEPDLTRSFSGHPQEAVLPAPPAAQGPWIWGGAGVGTAYWGPWGVSYASN